MSLSTRATSKWHFVSALPNGSPEIAKIGTLATLGPHNFVCRPLIEMGSKECYSPCQELSNGMLQAIYTQGNQVTLRLLMVGNQTANLIPDPSFDHKLWFRCPNGSCEPILDTYVPRAFQQYRELLKLLSLGPCNHPLKIQESTGISSPKVGVTLGVWGFIPSHFPTFPGACGVTPRLSLSSQSCKPFALVASPRLGLWHIKHQFLFEFFLQTN
jgi:hypothetical protein